VLTVIVTKMKITGRSICGVISYCDNNENNGGGGIYGVLTVIVAITERYICNVNSYCDNDQELYMQC
jgi:hypothetical protein